MPIGVIVLTARTNRLADLIPRVPDLLAAIASAKPGAATVVAGPWSDSSSVPPAMCSLQLTTGVAERR